MDYAELRYTIESELDRVLPDLLRAAPTAVVAQRIARHLGLDARIVAKHLLKLATVDARATHNGREVMRFGRKTTGWLWHAEPQAEGSTLQPGEPVGAKVAPRRAVECFCDDWERASCDVRCDQKENDR